MIPIKDSEPSGIFPLATISIVIICAIILFNEMSQVNLEEFVFKWALVPSLIDFSNFSTLYPFVTSIFLHGGFLHFLSNMWFLLIFGDNVEASLGTIKYIIFFLLAGRFASFVQFLFLVGSNVPILGASGAIAGVLGFYMVAFPKNKVDTLIPYIGLITTIRLPAQAVLLMWFVTQLFNGTAGFISETSATSGIAWWAHIGGFIFGAFIGLLHGNSKRSFNV